VSAAASQLVNSPQYKQAQQVVNMCLAREGGLAQMATHGKRHAFEVCVVPAGHLPAFETCWGKIPVSGLATKAGRRTYMVSVYTCAVQNR
jgi:hypothetical protein